MTGLPSIPRPFPRKWLTLTELDWTLSPVLRACFVDAMKWASQKAHRRYRSPTEALDPREIGLQNSLDFREIGLKNSLDFRKIGLKNRQTFWYFWGLKEVLQNPCYLRQHSSRRFVEVWVATLQIRPRTPVISVRFRHTFVSCREVINGGSPVQNETKMRQQTDRQIDSCCRSLPINWKLKLNIRV